LASGHCITNFSMRYLGLAKQRSSKSCCISSVGRDFNRLLDRPPNLSRV
jgi:hypothetical protein